MAETTTNTTTAAGTDGAISASPPPQQASAAPAATAPESTAGNVPPQQLSPASAAATATEPPKPAEPDYKGVYASLAAKAQDAERTAAAPASPEPAATDTQAATSDPFADLAEDSRQAINRLPSTMKSVYAKSWATLGSLERANAVREAKQYHADRERAFQATRQTKTTPAAAGAQQATEQTTSQSTGTTTADVGAQAAQPPTSANPTQTPASGAQLLALDDSDKAVLAGMEEAFGKELSEPLDKLVNGLLGKFNKALSSLNEPVKQAATIAQQQMQAAQAAQIDAIMRTDEQTRAALKKDIPDLADDAKWADIQRDAEARVNARRSAGDPRSVEAILAESLTTIARGTYFPNIQQQTQRQLAERKEQSLSASVGRGVTSTPPSRPAPTERDRYFNAYQQLKSGRTADEVQRMALAG